jgi:hypothetical protein
VSELDDQIARAGRRVAETERRVGEHLARTGPVLGRASSPDGAVTVVVAPGASPQEVRISQAALNMGAPMLADEIVRIANRAARDASARLHRSLERVVDPGTARGLTELGFEPGAPEDDEQQGTFLRGPR